MQQGFILFVCLLTVFGPALGAVQSLPSSDPLAERGEYLFTLAGCKHCHSTDDGTPLAGGRALETPFGTFFTPNITPDTTHGIGSWSLNDFKRSLRHGVSPSGGHYYPAFPYTAYTKISDDDIRALHSYLMSQPAVSQPNREHELAWFLKWRIAARVWQWLFFQPGAFTPDRNRDDAWNRGAYIAAALAHCSECHTPRNALGALQTERAYAGNSQGPDGELVPNITSHQETGIGNWSRDSLMEFLKYGELPNGEYTSGSMEPVIEGVSKLTDQDRDALVDFILSISPIEHRVSND